MNRSPRWMPAFLRPAPRLRPVLVFTRLDKTRREDGTPWIKSTKISELRPTPGLDAQITIPPGKHVIDVTWEVDR